MLSAATSSSAITISALPFPRKAHCHDAENVDSSVPCHMLDTNAATFALMAVHATSAVSFPSPALPLAMLRIQCGINCRWLKPCTPATLSDPPYLFPFYVVDAPVLVPVLAKCQPQMEVFLPYDRFFLLPQGGVLVSWRKRFLTPGHPRGMST